MKISIAIMALYAFVNLPVISLQGSSKGASKETILDFPGLARKYGYSTIQEHNVTTEDRYILKMFHIPGDKKKTVLLMHGFADSADTFILRGRKSLAAVLAESGYDVWLGNVRGNKYSRRHERLNPDKDKKFWDFSFHEMGIFDLRAFIDFILRENNVNSLSLIGHSQGNTLFYVLGSMKPEYNEKINIAIALAPICFLDVENMQFALSTILTVGGIINQLLLTMNQEEIFGESEDFFLTQFKNDVCTRRGVGYRICAEGIFTLIDGDDLEEFEPEFFYTVIEHYPTSASRRNALHLIQVAQRKQFAQFDYGPDQNLKIYKSKVSTPYDLNKVTMKIALLVSRNDKIVPLQNVKLLRDKLPNVVSYHVMERKKFNHIDYIWGKHMYKYLFPHILELLNKFS